MRHVPAARVKAAVLPAALKQLVSMGVEVKQGAATVSFKGEGAYAVWSWYGNDDNIDTVTSFRINYPYLPDNALMSRSEADLTAGYTLHELGHVLYTDNNESKGLRDKDPSGLLFACWNGLEDPRIEHAVIKSGKARGSRPMFRKLLNYLTGKIDSTWNPCDINHAPFALAILGRAALGNGNAFARGLLARIPEGKREIYAKAVDALKSAPLDRSGTKVVGEIVLQFLSDWYGKPYTGQENPVKPEPTQPDTFGLGGEQCDQQPKQQQSNSQPGMGDGDSDEDGEGSGGFGDDDESDEFDEFEDSDSGYNGRPNPEGDVDDGDGFGDDEDDEALRQADEDMMNSAEKSEGLKDNSFDLSGGGDDEDDSADDASGAGGDGYSDEGGSFDPEKMRSPEPDLNDLFKRIADRPANPVELPVPDGVWRSDMSQWRNIAEVDEKGNARSAKHMDKNSLPGLKAQLRRILIAPERWGWDTGANAGRFDVRRTQRLLSGSESVFRRRWEEPGIDTAMTVLIDMSGSMSGTLGTAVDVAWAIATSAESAGSAVEVLGFKTGDTRYSATYRGGHGGYDMAGEYLPISSRAGCFCPVLKNFRVKCREVGRNFTMAKRLADGGTPDYDAARNVMDRMASMPQKRKILLVITDGVGDYSSMKQMSEVSYELFGVDLIAVGICVGRETMNRAYSVHTSVFSLNDLTKAPMKILADSLTARDRRRK